MNEKPHRYRGKLAERPTLFDDPILFAGVIASNDGDTAAAERLKELAFQQWLALLHELLADCGQPVGDISKADWKGLALTLARRHVPAFMPMLKPNKSKMGAPRKNSAADEVALFLKMQELIDKGRHTERNAARLVAQSRKKKGESEDSVLSLFRRLKKSVDAGVRYVEQAHELRRRSSSDKDSPPDPAS